MLRLVIIILIIYLVIRIALRLVLTESPAQRRSRVNSRQGPQRSGTSTSDDASRFDHIEDAEFEEIPRKSADKNN